MKIQPYILIFNTLYNITAAEDGTVQKKGLTIWIFSTITVFTLIHLIDAVAAILFNGQIQLLQLYPILNGFLSQVSAQMYFYLSALTTTVLWGITCIIAFDNPVESFLNKILSDAKQQTINEEQAMEKSGEIFDLMYETLESDSETLGQVKDLIRNVRTEVKDIAPIIESMEKTKTDLNKIRKQLITLEEKVLFPMICPSCGKPTRADFKLCPYCGATMELPKITISNRKNIRIN
jgi:rubrerythrin